MSCNPAGSIQEMLRRAPRICRGRGLLKNDYATLETKYMGEDAELVIQGLTALDRYRA